MRSATSGPVVKVDEAEALIAWVRVLKREGATFVEIDRKMGFPEKWGGRVSWNVANRPRQPWEAEDAWAWKKPRVVLAAEPAEREPFGFQPAPDAAVREDRLSYAQPTTQARFCSACGAPLAGPFCAACGARAVVPERRP